jgi:hypothetical protein
VTAVTTATVVVVVHLLLYLLYGRIATVKEHVVEGRRLGGRRE